ncbi:Ribonuclease BN [Pseudovibrio axinellae]|uniref:Ribonuclease BN n=1 Tax=Pseudovibrio axinellae TaxID=989403 RepID=A0A165XHV0_9HYPH|nr:MBL fold metallo-hydrolase [Pseudovibrio axinellae]KZL17714.1 Ribonuclease BN [Pseudovibrio axinellae]SER42554.1 phosphoribosyl 1,2-cyclic phosphate phosphodiesterase [Pseudovibrio axinellae]
MTSNFKVTILGSGSSTGVPRIGGDWGHCDPNEPKNRRRRCALLVERFSSEGVTTVLVDTGPDLREQMLSAGVKHVDAVLYTHAHADHLHGIDDLRFYALMQRAKIPVYMDSFTSKRARAAFDYCFATPPGSSYPPILEENRLTDAEHVTIEGAGGPITALPFKVNHGDIDALGFRFEDLAYTPDVKDIPDSSLHALEGLDTWIIDALREKPHQSHFCVQDALEWVSKMKPAQSVLTNLHCDLDYQKLKSELPENICPAYDGWAIEYPIHSVA